MQQFHSGRPRLLVLVLLSMFAWALESRAQPVTWQALPFPTDSDWPGPTGDPAVITLNEVILNARYARSQEVFSGPLTIDCDVFVEARTTQGGVFTLFFASPGQPLDKDLADYTAFQMLYRDPGYYSGQDGLLITQVINKSGNQVWGEIPFTVTGGTSYHLSMGVAADGALSLSIDGQSYALPNSTAVPFSQFELQLGGWEPGDYWHVQNFTVVPEPATVMLVGVSLLGLAIVVRRRKNAFE
jgi:hypothetical protein